jgi:hypothetical protein
MSKTNLNFGWVAHYTHSIGCSCNGIENLKWQIRLYKIEQNRPGLILQCVEMFRIMFMMFISGFKIVLFTK